MVDELDLKLIEELQKDGRATYDRLAARLGISSATVSRRIGKLLEENTIRFTTVADTKKLGYQVRAFIALNIDAQKIDDVCNKLVENINVQLILTAIGRFDAFILVHFNTYEQLTDFIKNSLSPIEGVRHVETFYVSDMYKGYGVFRHHTE